MESLVLSASSCSVPPGKAPEWLRVPWDGDLFIPFQTHLLIIHYVPGLMLDLGDTTSSREPQSSIWSAN